MVEYRLLFEEIRTPPPPVGIECYGQARGGHFDRPEGGQSGFDVGGVFLIETQFVLFFP